MSKIERYLHAFQDNYFIKLFDLQYPTHLLMSARSSGGSSRSAVLASCALVVESGVRPAASLSVAPESRTALSPAVCAAKKGCNLIAGYTQQEI